jgi:RNA polymerase sigma-70 factor (ECF subfamily)
VTDEDQSRADLTPELVMKLRAGDPRAGVLLQTLYGDAILRFCRGYTTNLAAAEDARQEVFCKVLAADTVPEKFRAWLYRVARNYCRNLVRDRARRGPVAELPPASRVGEPRTGHLTRLVREEQQARLAEAVAALPEKYREVLELRYREELARSEISEVLGLPESTVKSRLFDGLKLLRAHTSLLTDR